jgi:hypothetical protein
MSLRVEQDQSYHSFADDRPWLGIDNAANTLSNLPLLAVGILGLILLWRNSAATRTLRFEVPAERYAYWALFGAVALTGVGSMYYHLAPDDARLVWDRLPISLAFTALVAAMISERLSVTAGTRLLLPLLLFGAGSVFYWRWSALQGAENLVPYGIAQYGSILAIFVLAVALRSRYSHGGYIFGVLALYALAKGAEMVDTRILELGHIVSGHTLKHLLAGVAVLLLIRMLQVRSFARTL